MRECFKEKGKGNTIVYKTKDDIDGYEYGSKYIVRLLLLFNIESCFQSENIRFDFDKYKTDRWDVEHIDSQNSASLQKVEERIQWMENVKFILGIEANHQSSRKETAEELLVKCKKYLESWKSTNPLQVEDKKFSNFYTEINKYFSYEEGIDKSVKDVQLDKKNKDNISNLTLLDSKTNREYKDAPFPYKRYCIIRNDKKGERFTPLCTRNVFLKYYSDQVSSVSQLDKMRWNTADKKAYLMAIHEMVDPIFEVEPIKKN